MRKLPEQNIIELLPPPIFNTEIILSPLANEIDENEIEFNKLSSGEKQLVYSVSSILYHLNNIDSVSGNKIRYQNINIVLEEIELYFHPELQRKYVKYILDSIERLQLTSINSINLCFITHSPFILSDIPSNNIMFLKVINGVAKQIMEKKNTFGANIHEILGDSFFMDNGYVGTFAQNKIEKTIGWLSKNRVKKEDELEFEKNKKYHMQIIALIDEPILKIKLSEMLSELDGNKTFYNNVIDEQIKFLTAQKK